MSSVGVEYVIGILGRIDTHVYVDILKDELQQSS